MLPAAPTRPQYLRHFDASIVQLMGPDPRGRAGEGADGTGRRLRGSIIQRGHSHAPPPGPARDPNGVMSMNKLMILPLAAATALAAGCASHGGYGGESGRAHV